MTNQQYAQEYFIDLFKSYARNYNKIFSKKYSPSIRELLNDYIELYNDIAMSPENQKLKYSLKAQLDVMYFFLKDTVLSKSLLKEHLNSLISKLKVLTKNTIDDYSKQSFNYYAVYKICSSLLKLLDKHNIYEIILSIIKETCNYREIDRCTECLINELLYDGYSIRYLQDWHRHMKNIYGNDTTKIIEEIPQLKKNKTEYQIYFTVKNDCTSLSMQYISDSIFIESIKKDDLSPVIATHLLFNETARAFRTKIYSMDEYSATNQLIKAFDAYYLIVNLMNEKKYSINYRIASVLNDQVNKFNIEANDSNYVLPNLDTREKNDLEDFLKYRDEVYQRKLVVGEIFTIERSLNILKNGNYYNDENMLINLWNVLESILSYYSDDSIISKAKTIIPKIICLYYLKDKLNTFWNTLLKSREYKDEVINFIQNSKLDNDSAKYDISKLLSNIRTYGEGLCAHFGTNKNILGRQYRELGMIIDKQCNICKDLEDLHMRIEYDIVRIYRTRNVLVHSGNTTKTNILLKNARLMQYISHLMGVILHYKMKNSNHSISEILYSIPETYDRYIKDCKLFMRLL